MKRFTFVLLVLAVGCGPYKVQMEPMKGELTVKFDLTDIKRYFRAECEALVPPSEVEDCVDEKVGKFLSLLSEGT